MKISTATDNLLLPIIDTYNVFGSEYFVNQLYSEIEYYKDDVFDMHKLELKNLSKDTDLSSVKLLKNNDIDCYDFEIDYDLFNKDLINILDNNFISEFVHTINNLFDSDVILEYNVDEELDSPREYNFRTDRVFLDLVFDENKLSLLFDYFEKNILKTKEFDEYLTNNYTSYDGFMSFVENNPTDFFNNAKQFKIEFEIMLGLIFHYVCNYNSFKDIEEGINSYQWQFIEYAHSELYINEYATLNDEFYYTLEELQEIVNENIDGNQLVIF